MCTVGKTHEKAWPIRSHPIPAAHVETRDQTRELTSPHTPGHGCEPPSSCCHPQQPLTGASGNASTPRCPAPPPHTHTPTPTHTPTHPHPTPKGNSSEELARTKTVYESFLGDPEVRPGEGGECSRAPAASNTTAALPVPSEAPRPSLNLPPLCFPSPFRT